MINVDDDVKNAYLNNTTQIDRIIIDEQYCRISNVELNDDCYIDGNIFGTAIAKTLTFDIEMGIDVENKEFEYQTGILVNGQYKWISLGNFIVQEVESNKTTYINRVTSIDYMLKTNIPYVSELSYNTKLIKLSDVLNEVCVKSGLLLGTNNFTNKDFIVDSNQFEEGTINRDVIKAIAEITGTVAKIKSDNKLYLINPNTQTTQKTITNNEYSEIEIKRNTQPINEVVLGMKDVEGENVVIRDEESIAINGENIVRFNDNPFAYNQNKREQLITALFNAIKGFKYKSFLAKIQMQPYMEAMDKIKIQIDDETFDSYIFRFTYKSPNGLDSEIEAPSIIKATVDYENTLDSLERIKRTEIIVNKQNQTIESVVELATDSSNKVAQVSQSVDEIKQEIGNLTDITTTIKGQGVQEATGINESEPIKLRIYPIENDITPLYPSDNLYPSDTLYPHNREFVIHQTAYVKEEEKQDDVIYNLPCNLYYLNSDIFDEFIMDYETQKCYVIHRVQIDSNFNKSARLLEVIEYFDYPQLYMNNGDYEFSLPAFTTAYMEITLMLQNIYTSQFATQVELKSAIQQTEDKIDLIVSEEITPVVGEVERLSSEIEQTVKSISLKVNNGNTSAGIVITLEREDGSTQTLNGTINMTGLVNFNDLSGNGTTTINGANIKTGTISGDRLDVTKLRANQGTIAGFTVDDTSLRGNGISVGSDGTILVQTVLPEYNDDGEMYGNFVKTQRADSHADTSVRKINIIGTNQGVNVAGYVSNNFNLYAPVSDINLKKNIKETKVNALDYINQIEHVEFNWKRDGEYQQNGYKAQQLEEICKDFVVNVPQGNGTDLLQVRDFNMLPYITKAIQELSQENQELKNRINDLERRINDK